MSNGRHRKSGKPRGQARRRGRISPVDRARPWLVAITGALVVAAALMAALADDPRLLRVAVVLAAMAVLPLAVAALSVVPTYDGRRLTAELAALRSAVEELSRRETAPAPPTVAFAVSSTYSPTYAAAPAESPAATPARRVIDLDQPRGAVEAGDGAAVFGSLDQAATTAGAQPAARGALVLNLAALEDEVEPHRR